MNWSRLLIKTVLVFFLVYYTLAFVSRLPGIQKGIHQFLRPRMEAFLKKKFPDAFIQLSEYIPKRGDIQIINYENQEIIDGYLQELKKSGNIRRKVKGKEFGVDLHYLFAFPLIFMTSLIICIPLDWKKKGLAYFLGIWGLILYIRLNLRLKMLLILQLNPIGVYQLSNYWKNTIEYIVPRITPGVTITFVIFISIGMLFLSNWIFSLFKSKEKEDMEKKSSKRKKIGKARKPPTKN